LLTTAREKKTHNGPGLWADHFKWKGNGTWKSTPPWKYLFCMPHKTFGVLTGKVNKKGSTHLSSNCNPFLWRYSVLWDSNVIASILEVKVSLVLPLVSD
jgi:hypothetical protein